jgi:hypothetical protein
MGVLKLNMLELSSCTAESLIHEIPGDEGEDYNHTSDPLLKNDKSTNYGHKGRMLMATVLRDLLAPQEYREFSQEFSIRRPILDLGDEQIMLKEMENLAKNVDKYKNTLR